MYYYNASLLQSALLLLDTLVPALLPLLNTFLELLSVVVQDLQHYLSHFAGISRTFPFHLAFRTKEQEKVALRKVL